MTIWLHPVRRVKKADLTVEEAFETNYVKVVTRNIEEALDDAVKSFKSNPNADNRAELMRSMKMVQDWPRIRASARKTAQAAARKTK